MPLFECLKIADIEVSATGDEDIYRDHDGLPEMTSSGVTDDGKIVSVSTVFQNDQ
jgi:hypothetical protein